MSFKTHEKNAQKDAFINTGEQEKFKQNQKQNQNKQPLPPPNGTQINAPKNQWKGGAGLNRPLAEIEEEAKQRWESQYVRQDDLKYHTRTVKNSSGKLVTYFCIGKDDEVEDWLEEQRVELHFDLDTLDSMDMETLQEMWKGKLNGVPEGYVPTEEDLMLLRTQFIEDTLAANNLSKDLYYSSLISGGYSGNTLNLIKQLGIWDTFCLIEQTTDYYKYNQSKNEYIQKSYENVPRQKVKGTSKLRGNKFSYERQHDFSNNCYGCSLAGNFNHLLATNKDMPNQKKLTQDIVRDFVPRFLSDKEMQKLKPGGNGDFEAQRDDISLFAGHGKSAFGNLLAISDVIFDSKKGLGRKDVAIFEKSFGLDQAPQGVIRNNILEAIKEELHKAIDDGHMVSLLTHKHYVTVVEIKDNRIRYLDSMSKNADHMEEKDLETFLLGKYKSFGVVELSYMKKIKPEDVEELKKEYSGLGVDEQTNEIYRKSISPQKENDAAHRAGIVITQNVKDIMSAGNADIERFVRGSVCLNRSILMNEQQTRDWEKKNDTLSQEAEAEWAEVNARRMQMYRQNYNKKQTKPPQNNGKTAQTSKQDQTRNTKQTDKIGQANKQDQTRQTADKIGQANKTGQGNPPPIINDMQPKLSPDHLMKQATQEHFVNAVKGTSQKQAEEKTSRMIVSRYRNKTEQVIDEANAASCARAVGILESADPMLKREQLADDAIALLQMNTHAGGKTKQNAQRDGCRVIEKIFRNVIAFDLGRLTPADQNHNIEKQMADILVENESIFALASDQENPIFRQYEELIGQPNTPATLDAKELGLIKEKLTTIRVFGDLFRSVIDLYKVTPQEVRDLGGFVHQMSVDDIDNAVKDLYSGKKNYSPDMLKQLAEFYEKAKRLKRAEVAFGEVDQIPIEEKTQNRLVAALDKKEQAVAEAIRTEAAESQANLAEEQHLASRTERMRRAVKPGKKNYFDKDLALTCLQAAQTNDMCDEEAAELYRVLRTGAKNITYAQKAEYISAVEKLFSAVMNFDISKLAALNNNDEFLEDTSLYVEGRDMFRYARAIEPLIKEYREITKPKEGAPADGHVLDEKQLAIVEARVKMLSEGLTGIAKAKKQDPDFKTRKKVMAAVSKKEDDAKGIQADSVYEELCNKARQYQNSGTITAVKADTLTAGCGTAHKVRAKLTVTDREKQMKDPKSELFKKKQQKDLLASHVAEGRDRIAKNRRNISFSARCLVSDTTFQAVSAFFTGNALEDATLLQQLSKEEDAGTAMDTLTDRFLSLRIDGIDLSSFDSMISCSAQLEMLTQQVESFRSFVFEDVHYREDTLKQQKLEDGVTLFDKVNQHLQELTAVTEYYRAAKLLLSNPYYLSHYNDEMSFLFEEGDSREQIEVSRLLMICSSFAEKIQTVFGVRAQGAAGAYPDYRNQAINSDKKSSKKDRAIFEADAYKQIVQHNDGGAMLKQFEAAHLKRAYEDAKPDLSLFSKAKAEALFAEIKKLNAMHLDLKEDDIVQHTPKYAAALKEMSPEMKQIFEFFGQNSVQGYIDVVGNRDNPKLWAQIERFLKAGEDSRMHTMDVDLRFKDPDTQETIKPGITMTRLKLPILEMAASEGMSNEEAMELIEGLNVSRLKDCDMNDKKQAAAARDICLKSVAKVVRMHHNYLHRYANTYGLIGTQVPTPFLALMMPETFGKVRTRLEAVGIDDLINTGIVQKGKDETSILDTLVSEGYIEKDLADDFKNLADHLAHVSSEMGNEMRTVGRHIAMNHPLAFQNFKEERDVINSHRNDRGIKDLPKLSEKEEQQLWKTIRSTKNVPKDAFTATEESSLNVSKSNAAYAEDVAKLRVYRNRLEGLDQGGHSKNYIRMMAKLDGLLDYMEGLYSKHAEGGKNVSPQDFIELKMMYGELSELCRTYLAPKNRNHKKALYRQRYDTVDEMQQLVNKDFGFLQGRLYDNKTQSLDELLTESRTLELSVNEKDIEKLSGQMNVRQVFETEIEGEKKMVAFTASKTLPSATDSKKNLYQPLMPSKDAKWAGFPELAMITADGSQQLLDDFFEQTPVYNYFINVINKAYRKSEKKKEREKIETMFETFLGELWRKNAKKFMKQYPQQFKSKDKNPFLERFNKDKQNILDSIQQIGEDYANIHGRINTHKEAGIDVGDNIDKRNIAMSLVSKAIGTEKVIAESKLARMKVNKDGKEEVQEGTVMEWIGGMNVDELKTALENGDIICDNDAEILRQLSDMQVTDYICGNIDRNANNFKILLTPTEELNAKGKPIMRIERIVGIDNDLSCGKLFAKNIKGYIGRLNPPPTMQVMRRETANKIITLDKSRLFLILGPTLTQEEKEAMWSRIEMMQQTIRKADEEADGTKDSIRILEDKDFAAENVRDLALSNTNYNNLYRTFVEETKYKPQEKKDMAPHRHACKEQLLELTMDIELDDEKNTYYLDSGIEMMKGFIDLSQREKMEILNEKDEIKDGQIVITEDSLRVKHYSMMGKAAREFDKTVGKLFSSLSTSKNYGVGIEYISYEYADKCGGEYAEKYGLEHGILDLFFLNEKPLFEVFPNLPDIIDAYAKFVAGAEEYNKGELAKNSARDLVGKAFLMAAISSGRYRVTIANYQPKMKDGSSEEDELVITDLNVIRNAPGNKLPGIENDDPNGNSKSIKESRKNRAKRFARIQTIMEERKKKGLPKPVADEKKDDKSPA